MISPLAHKFFEEKDSPLYYAPENTIKIEYCIESNEPLLVSLNKKSPGITLVQIDEPLSDTLQAINETSELIDEAITRYKDDDYLYQNHETYMRLLKYPLD